jgi:hypothetical protein
MTINTYDRCDAGLSTGKRCQNAAQFWIVCPDPLRVDGEPIPVAVCELHRRDGPFHRMGPDRKRQYAERHREPVADAS